MLVNHSAQLLRNLKLHAYGRQRLQINLSYVVQESLFNQGVQTCHEMICCAELLCVFLQALFELWAQLQSSKRFIQQGFEFEAQSRLGHYLREAAPAVELLLGLLLLGCAVIGNICYLRSLNRVDECLHFSDILKVLI